nr:MAG TPA: hypothetical protein [Caudoviricetes sp.]
MADVLDHCSAVTLLSTSPMIATIELFVLPVK